MKENEPDPRDKLLDNYLEDDQLDDLFERYQDVHLACYKECMDEIDLPDDFLLEMCMWWAAYEIETRPFYQAYVKELLIRPEYVYDLRDYLINYKNNKYKSK